MNKGQATLVDSKPLALAKADHKKAMQAVTAAKLALMMERAKAFKL